MKAEVPFSIFLSTCEIIAYDTTPTPSRKRIRSVGNNLTEGLMMNLLWNIRLQERQKLVRPGNSDIGCGMTALSGAYPGSGNRFGRVVLGEFRSKVDGKDGCLGWRGSGVLLHDTDVIIGCLKAREEKKWFRMRARRMGET
jgi:hypothetical protein